MNVVVRSSIYRALKQVSHANCVTIGSLVQQLITHKFDVFTPECSRAIDLYSSILEIKDVGIILNNYTKQINANIRARKQIDTEFLGLFREILRDAKLGFVEYRESNYKSFFTSFNLMPGGDFNKINNRVLGIRRWDNLRFEVDDDMNISLINSSNAINMSPSKYIKSLIALFLNQGNLFDKETKALLGFLNKSLYKIKVNAFQIYRDKKRNASANERIIAKNIISLVDILLSELKEDPILKSGRDFSYERFSKTLNLFPGIK